MKKNILLFFLITSFSIQAQVPVSFSGFSKKNGAKAELKNTLLSVSWPAEGKERGKIIIDLEKNKPLFKSIQLSKMGVFHEIGADLDPSFLLTVGKRTLSKTSGGW